MSLPRHISALVLHTESARYTRLKALTSVAAGLMTPDNVNREAGDLLASIWRESSSLPLLINCSGIVALSDYALHSVTSLTDNLAPIVFFKASETVVAHIDRQLPPKHGKHIEHLSDGQQVVIYGSEQNFATTLEVIVRDVLARDEVHVMDIVRSTFHKNDSGLMEPLPSTPILASGVYNARRIICDPAQFNWTVLRLEEQLDRLVPDWDLARHCLLSGSLRASPFAGALAFAKTSARSLEILDHLGPHPVLLEEHDLGPGRANVEYIYIGDFMIGGTEMKIAANWAARRNCRLTKALLLGTLWPRGRYNLSDITIERLVSLERLHPDAKYSVTI